MSKGALLIGLNYGDNFIVSNTLTKTTTTTTDVDGNIVTNTNFTPSGAMLNLTDHYTNVSNEWPTGYSNGNFEKNGNNALNCLKVKNKLVNVLGYESTNIILLTDVNPYTDAASPSSKRPTLANITGALQTLANQGHKEIFIYMAGETFVFKKEKYDMEGTLEGYENKAGFILSDSMDPQHFYSADFLSNALEGTDGEYTRDTTMSGLLDFYTLKNLLYSFAKDVKMTFLMDCPYGGSIVKMLKTINNQGKSVTISPWPSFTEFDIPNTFGKLENYAKDSAGTILNTIKIPSKRDISKETAVNPMISFTLGKVPTYDTSNNDTLPNTLNVLTGNDRVTGTYFVPGLLPYKFFIKLQSIPQIGYVQDERTNLDIFEFYRRTKNLGQGYEMKVYTTEKLNQDTTFYNHKSKNEKNGVSTDNDQDSSMDAFLNDNIPPLSAANNLKNASNNLINAFNDWNSVN